jgi:hypothetical protein
MPSSNFRSAQKVMQRELAHSTAHGQLDLAQLHKENKNVPIYG